MRLAVCALSAILLSGCSWFGAGNSSQGWSGQGANAHGGYGCNPAYGAGQYGNGQYGYGQNGYAAGCGPADGYQYQSAANGYGAGGLGLRGGQSATQYGAAQYGAASFGGGPQYGGRYGHNGHGGGTLLAANAPYGGALGGQYRGAQQIGRQNVQFANAGQFANGGQYGGVQTVQGAPIYVPQPYPAYYNAGAECCGPLRGGAALPFGIEAGIGTEFGFGGQIFPGEVERIAPGSGFLISALPTISFNDAYDEAVHYSGAATYDISPSTTLIGQLGYSSADGNLLQVGTIDDGAGTSEDLFVQWSDKEQWTLEGGVRQYFGGWNNGTSGVRPYVTATGGFTHDSAIDVTQSSATLAPAALNTQRFVNAGWTPTAAGLVGVEMQVGARTAIGVETGIRWRDDLNAITPTTDRWSIPLRLRGRVSF